MHQIVHGTDSTLAPSLAPTRAAIGGLAMCCPKGIDCAIATNSSAAITRGIFTAFRRVYTPPSILKTSPGSQVPTLKQQLLLSTYLSNSIMFLPG